jgi:malate dehydrogenase
MKISVIGAGNVGSTTALRLAQEGLGEILLVDIVKGLACGKSLDMEDARLLLKLNYSIRGTEDFSEIRDSDIIVTTAGLPRRPGMTREELLLKNAEILKNVSLKVKEYAPKAVYIVVTNPLDVMTNYALKVTGFNPKKILGMGVSLDSARFANLISKELNVPVTDIEAVVIGSHGEGMLPLPRFSSIKGAPLGQFVDDAKIKDLVLKTVNRGAEIVGMLGSGSAYYAPSAAIATLVRGVVRDEKSIIGVCAKLNGEYGIRGTCIGVPCRIGRDGIEGIVELQLNPRELEALVSSAEIVQRLTQQLPG